MYVFFLKGGTGSAAGMVRVMTPFVLGIAHHILLLNCIFYLEAIWFETRFTQEQVLFHKTLMLDYNIKINVIIHKYLDIHID